MFEISQTESFVEWLRLVRIETFAEIAKASQKARRKLTKIE